MEEEDTTCPCCECDPCDCGWGTDEQQNGG
jgi:hypothetical protein